METFAAAREFVDDPRYKRHRALVLAALDLDDIDVPLRGLIIGFARLPYCYTIQSCYGHFVHAAQRAPRNLQVLPDYDPGPIEYRMAYLALCLENSKAGRNLRLLLERICAADTESIQFGSSEWLWKRHRNSYAVQVEPDRFRDRDVAILGHQEALHVQQVRDRFFASLAALVREMKDGLDTT
ncbi:MAG: hypothetical protein AB1792_09980 [Candidatus Zixiibacteriota bacterium]